MMVVGCTSQGQPTTPPSTTHRQPSPPPTAIPRPANFDSRCRVPTPGQWQHLKNTAKLNLDSREQAEASSKDGSAVFIQRMESGRTLGELMRLPSRQRSRVVEL